MVKDLRAAPPRPVASQAETVEAWQRKARVIGSQLLTHFYMMPLAIVACFPLYWLVSTSVKWRGNILKFPPQLFPDPITLENYQRIFVTNPFDIWLLNSAVVTTLATIGTVVSAALVAYGFARLNFIGRDLWFSIVIATMMIPGIVLLIPTFILMKYLGWVDTWYPLIVPYYLGGGSFNVFLIRQFIMTLPYDLDEAAKIDGASNLRIFWQLLLPNIKPALAVVAVFAAMAHWNDFLNPLIYLNTTEKLTVAVGIRLVMSASQVGPVNTGALMAGGTMMTIPAVVLFFLAQRYFMKGIVLTGLTGR